jgi:hypothetical protein
LLLGEKHVEYEHQILECSRNMHVAEANAENLQSSNRPKSKDHMGCCLQRFKTVDPSRRGVLGKPFLKDWFVY